LPDGNCIIFYGRRFRMKKLVIMMFGLMIALSLTFMGCQKKEEMAPKPAETTAPAAAPETAPAPAPEKKEEAAPAPAPEQKKEAMPEKKEAAPAKKSAAGY
jgi:hypothetical protein